MSDFVKEGTFLVMGVKSESVRTLLLFHSFHKVLSFLFFHFPSGRMFCLIFDGSSGVGGPVVSRNSR